MSSAPTQYCPNCGESNPIDAQTCWNCGQPLPTSDERQELWATRAEDGDAGGERDGTAPTDDRPAGGSDRTRGGQATEPFPTGADRNTASGGADRPAAESPSEETQTGETRSYSAWGVPNRDAFGSSGRQRAVSGSGSPASADPSPATTPAGSSGYGPGDTSGAQGGTQQGYPGSGQPAYGSVGPAPGQSAPPWYDQSGYGQAPGQQPYGQAGSGLQAYGQPGYGAWTPGGADGFPAGSGTPDPYAPDAYAQGAYGQQPYGQNDYGQQPYGQTQYGPGGGYPGDVPGGGGPGGPVLAPGAGSRGPSGCLLGALGVVLIALVGAVLVAVVAYNAATGGQLRDGLRDVASTEVTQLGPVDVPEDGRLTVSEADVNRTIRRYTDDYGAISDPTFAIDPNGVVLDFSVLGIDSSYRSGLIAEGGQLRLTDPRASGAASRVLGAGDMAGIVEPALNDILRQSGVTATGVELGDGELTVLIAGTGATPAAGTPAAASVAGSSASPIATGSVAPTASGSAAPAASGSATSKPGDFIGIFGRGSASPSPSAAP